MLQTLHEKLYEKGFLLSEVTTNIQEKRTVFLNKQFFSSDEVDVDMSDDSLIVDLNHIEVHYELFNWKTCETTIGTLKELRAKLKELLGLKKDAKFYFYNGFSEPKLLGTIVDLQDLTISDNYLGDLTDEVQLEIESVLDNDDIDIEHQDEAVSEILDSYNIYPDPSLEFLEDLNVNHFGLPSHRFLENWID